MSADLATGAVKVVDPREDLDWAALVSGPGGTLFGSPPWIRAVAAAYDFEPSARVHLDAGRPVAGLASVEVRDLRGPRIVSLPFCDFLDPVGDDSDDEWQRLVAPLLAPDLPVQLRVRRAQAPRRDPRFARVDELLWHSTDLRRPKEEVLAGFSGNARRAARFARREGVTVTFGSTLDDVRAFHDLHRGTRKRKYRLLAQPFAFFEHIWRQFSPLDGIVVGLAHHDGEVIGGGLYLIWEDVMYYKFGASVAERLNLKPNDLLAAESVALACDRGARRYDWGVSDQEPPGLAFFKRKFATDEDTVAVLRHRPEGLDDWQGRAAGALLGQVTDLLTSDDVPDEVTRRAGELLYRHFC